MPIHQKVGRLEHGEVELWEQQGLCLWSWPAICDNSAAGPEHPATVVRGDAKESDFQLAGAAVMGPGAGVVTVLHREKPAGERLSELKDEMGK